MYSDDDSEIDCIPMVYNFCSTGTIRKPNGECVEYDDCSNECNGEDGKTLNGVGLCACDKVRSIDDICNRECRVNCIKTYLVDSYTLEIFDPVS